VSTRRGTITIISNLKKMKSVLREPYNKGIIIFIIRVSSQSDNIKKDDMDETHTEDTKNAYKFLF
jgi:hypothetical protein